MDGLDFQSALPPAASDPARVDIALFVGFVRRRPIPARAAEDTDADRLNLLPPWLRAWFRDWDWKPGRHGRTAEDLVALEDVPVPIDGWDAFDALFAWDERQLDAQRRCDSTLGAAVRRFFAQGGRKCYVVRVGDPWPVMTPLTAREALRPRVFPSPRFGAAAVDLPTPMDPSTWRGIAHLLGLPDVSFVCAPDLPELFAVDMGGIPPETAPESEERFVECSARTAPEETRSLRSIPPPRCDAAGFAGWGGMVSEIAMFLNRFAREAQFIGAVPLPADEESLRARPDVLALPVHERRAATRMAIFSAQRAQWREAGAIQSAFVQLTYPWLRTRESRRLPGDLEPPDACLAGLLAHNALTAGTWRAAGRRTVPELMATIPVLGRSELAMEVPFGGVEGSRRRPLSLRQRISVFAPSSQGHQLVSDVTTDDDEAYRPANVSRLVAVILRAARAVGQDAVFDNSGEALWRRLRESLEGLLLNLWSDGALWGASPEDAFEVRCDRSTMTQNDLDAGRVVARVQFSAASPIERITVVLSMDEGGAVSLVSTQSEGGREAA
jgi:hypothetical protein